MSGLTVKQVRCLEAIKRLTVDGVPPSYSELQADLGGIGKGSVHRLVQCLADRGHIVVTYGRARSIMVVDVDLNPDRLAALDSATLRNVARHIKSILTERAAA